MSSINTLFVEKFARLDQHAPLLSARWAAAVADGTRALD